MRATVEYVERKFAEFNRLMFRGRLPQIPVELSNAKSFLGQIMHRPRRNEDDASFEPEFKMRINARIDLPESVLEDTIIHEMIHFFILWNGLHDTSTHGEIFKAMMLSINAVHGRHIGVSYRPTSPEEVEQSFDSRPKWHVIAAVYLRSGGMGVKVLPRTMPKIVDYYNKVSSAADVKEVRLYLHNDPFFNRYPVSGAFRIHSIRGEVLEEHLQHARPLTVRGSQVIQK